MALPRHPIRHALRGWRCGATDFVVHCGAGPAGPPIRRALCGWPPAPPIVLHCADRLRRHRLSCTVRIACGATDFVGRRRYVPAMTNLSELSVQELADGICL